MLSIQTNYNSLVAQNSLGRSNSAMGTAMERLSTGFRINSAKDDAAGLQIANRLEAQSRGMGVAMRNSQDAISMMQTAEGSLDELTNIAYRMKDLATQGANGTNGAAELAALDAEYQELKAEATRIMDETTYGAGEKLLNGGKFGAGAVTFQIGASAAETLDVDVSAEIAAIDFSALGSLTDNAASNGEITAVDALFNTVNEARSKFGANINRLEHTISNLSNIVENTEAAKGRIMDTDFAVETANMTKNQLLVQAGTNILAQSNQMGGLVMGLL
ncbi:lateral flagellin LafA [Ferrimonas balearica]|uniref:lateral flagellin LafA n=1 Tax=Ferrimonas balearica TaxID=44012 RepID=UPI001C99C083|nr:lateral flagellin LafA [Ferrimonas balearica]MBY5920029.1 lateral flagellin LafA [Ferrimonas balearica]MBY5997286.1 lateral flagellin LafA [Ferrimonas balearica]